ncbi:hypothetical protein ACF08W_34475 [Streptomyces sp. NPDC015144]|uniref:hypothetical protein n=1 Tax=Streptomyces sp. NPDC015144 TaxID=3364944 RepID=UPI0036F4C030
MKSLSRKRATSAAVAFAATAAATAAGLVLAVAPAAQAVPGDCTVSSGSGSLSSFCASGTGLHRIHAVLNPLDPRLPQRVVLGEWAPVGQSSVVSNPWGAGYVANVWVDRTD